MYNNDSRTFVRGRVVSVDNERLETDPYDHSRYLGEQELTVLILDGEQLPTTQYSIMTGACHLASLWWYLPR